VNEIMSNLSESRLYLRQTVLKRNELTGEVFTAIRHTYESVSSLYDIDIFPNNSERLAINGKTITIIPDKDKKYFDFIREHISTPMQSEPYNMIDKISDSELQDVIQANTF
jgi:hypothetical protein